MDTPFVEPLLVLLKKDGCKSFVLAIGSFLLAEVFLPFADF